MKKIIILFFVLILTGCSGLFTSNDNVRYFYVLNPLDENVVERPPARVRLNVLIPEVPDWLDTENIILLRTKNQVDFYAEARWVSRPSAMIGDIIMESLMRNDVAKDIFYAGTQQGADYVLLTEVIAFDADYSESEKAPVVRIEMHVRLVNPQGMLVYQFRVKSSVQARQNTLPSIINAFDAAMEDCLEDLVIETRYGLSRP